MSQADLFDALIAWSSANAQLTGRIKELALSERDRPEAGPELGSGDDFRAVIDAVRATRVARLEVARAYEGVRREFPPDLLADVPREDRP